MWDVFEACTTFLCSAFGLGFCLLLVCGIYWIPCVSVVPLSHKKTPFKSRLSLEFEFQSTSLHLLWKFSDSAWGQYCQLIVREIFGCSYRKYHFTRRVSAAKVEGLGHFHSWAWLSTCVKTPLRLCLVALYLNRWVTLNFVDLHSVCEKYCHVVALQCCSVMASNIEILPHNPIWSFLGAKSSIF